MKNGFTFIETMITIVIISLLASLSYSSYQKFAAGNELRQTCNELYVDLRSLHQTALKYDTKVFVKFYAAQCSVYVDTNNSGSPDANDLKNAIKFSSNIALGIASNGPAGAPASMSWSTTGIAGNWSTQMTVNNDPIGTTCSGAIYLKSKRLNKVTYCIGIASTMLTLKQYKWDGSSWSSI
jgi:prepilin-type N-terminal cleavage/methylation domain-containing protein